jgi:hypothetical protein
VAGPENPFESIESAHQYMRLLNDVLDESRREIQGELALARADGADRRSQALALVDYNLGRLKHHVGVSQRLLNDLRTLRRLLLAERAGVPAPAPIEEAD